MARPEGVEPPASVSGGQRSIQLSYGRIIFTKLYLSKNSLLINSLDKMFLASGGKEPIDNLFKYNRLRRYLHGCVDCVHLEKSSDVCY